jgi:integrase
VTTFWDPKSKGYRYDFRYLKRRHVSPRGFPTEREAKDAEAERRRTLRRQAAGLEAGGVADSPSFHEWANVYVDHLEKRGRRVDSVEHVLRVVLRYFGRRPDRPLEPHEQGPYHDLRLIDPIVDPSHLLRFEDWMRARGISAATRNRYRSALSGLYTVAMRPQFRISTGVTANPIDGVERDVERGRTVTLTLAQLQAILAIAPRHIWLAIVIAGYAPMLRLGNILALRWGIEVADDLSFIMVERHKTSDRTGRPLVTPVTPALRAVLQAARDAQPAKVPWVVHYRRRRLKTIDTGLQAVCRDAGVTYGQRAGGATFHTIRHTAASMLAALGVSEGLRKDTMGHLAIATTQRYTHLTPLHLVAPLAQLAEALPLVGPVVELPSKRRPRRRAKATLTPGAVREKSKQSA